jgi:hypothetical protein
VNHADRSLDDARERAAGDIARAGAAGAWLGVLLAGLAAAAGLTLLVYSAFGPVFGAYAAG